MFQQINESEVVMDKYWRKPTLNVKGQSVFWDAQAEIYESADMTVENSQEINFVIDQCRELPCREIITLGGAVGCRDPKMILDEIFLKDHGMRCLPKVIFNDLSHRQVHWARENVLSRFSDAGIEINYLPGEIKSVCKTLDKHTARRLFIGVYNAQSFFEAKPELGYPVCGFEQYLENSKILGQEFLMDWIRFDPNHKNNLVPCSIRSHVSTSDSYETRALVKEALRIFHEAAVSGMLKNILALQIIGRSKGRAGFFLSHWYTSFGFKQMLEKIFPRNSFSIAETLVAKGMVYVIEPLGSKPHGVVTVLNNVIGNVLPHSQIETLVAIREILS